MSRTWRIYYNIVFGGFGGLAAYLVVGSLPDLIPHALFWELVTGFLAGAGIGALLGAADGVLSKNASRAMVGAGRGGVIGSIGGIVGLAIGEGLFLLTQGGFIGRAVGWGFVGAIVGTSEGIANRAPRKVSYGALGGTLGGLIGGAVFEALTQAALNFAPTTATFDPQAITRMQTIAAAVGLTLVGAWIGSLIALAERIFFNAWFKVMRGREEGKDYNVVKSAMTIGSDDRYDIPVYDPDVEGRVAIVRQRGKTLQIEGAGAASLIRAGGNAPMPINEPQTLADGDRVLAGKTLLLFRHLSILFLLSSLIFATPAAAQSAVVRIFGFDAGNFPRVRVLVSVTDSQGRAIQQLRQDAFKIVEDGRDGAVVAINLSSEPVHAGLIIDHSGSMAEQNKLPDAQIAANAFVDELRAQDDAFVSAFADEAALLQNFTSDRALLKAAIQQIQVGGGTAFYDAVYENARQFENRQTDRKKTLILLTDGLDNREENWGLLDFLRPSHGSKHTLEEAIAKAKELQVAVYTIGLGSDADQTRLQRLASETGGRFFHAPRGDQLKELYRLIAEQLQKEYAVDFNSPRPLTDGTQRRVQVTVTLPDGSAQTGEGVYVAGFLFNRLRADWLIGALIGLILLTLGVAPILVRAIFTPRATPDARAPSLAQCPRCGNAVRAGARFCAACGAGLPPSAPSATVIAQCPNCGRAGRAGARFCAHCRFQLR